MITERANPLCTQFDLLQGLFPDRFRQTCNKSVDLPIPGSPPTRTREPFTTPPPNTRSSSGMDVEIRSSSDIFIAESGTGFASVAGFIFPEVLSAFRSTSSSTNVFHSLHAGHWPIHLDDSYPQFWQKKRTGFCFCHILSLFYADCYRICSF